jgi:hypothetical protein
MIRRTRQEREALVRQWRASGKTMTAWCSEQQIPVTTFCGWAYAKRALKGNKMIARSDFTELKNEVPTAKVLIEWCGCKIHADPETASTILEKCLPIIGRFSC